MKREISMIATVLLLLTLFMLPMSTAAGVDTTPTTTRPYTTTTTGWDCISTTRPWTTTEPTTTSSTLRREPSSFDPYLTTTTSTICGGCTTNPYTTTSEEIGCVTDTTTYPPTTTSTIVLTGPDGINPDYTTVPPTTGTTEAPSNCGNCIDLLSNAEITTSEKVSMLGNPAGGYWLSCDCYSLDGGTIVITPNNGYGINLADYRYLHFTVRANVPISITFFDNLRGVMDTSMWFAEAAGCDVNVLPEGPYVMSLDLYEYYDATFEAAPETIEISEIYVSLFDAGSISVGHIALSNQPICYEEAPLIQTTTKPSFPWDTTGTTTTTSETLPPIAPPTITTYHTTVPTATTHPVIVTTIAPPTTSTTTSPYPDDPTTMTQPITDPTVGDVLLPGDANFDGELSTNDVRMILLHAVGNIELSGDGLYLADFNGDGDVNSSDARAVLVYLIDY